MEDKNIKIINLRVNLTIANLKTLISRVIRAIDFNSNFVVFKVILKIEKNNKEIILCNNLAIDISKKNQINFLKKSLEINFENVAKKVTTVYGDRLMIYWKELNENDYNKTKTISK